MALPDIFLRAGDATPSTIVLRDPTVPDSSGVTGTLAWTEDDDGVSLAGTLTVTGTIAWTEADDTVAIGTTVTVSGSLAWTEADDTVAAAATVTVSGALSWTEADDVLAAGSTVTVTTALAWTEDEDAVALTGDVVAAGVDGALAWVEADDIVAMTGLAGGISPQPDTHDGGKKPKNRAFKRAEERRKEELKRAFAAIAEVPELAGQIAEIKADYAYSGAVLRIDFDALMADVRRVQWLFDERDRIEEENAAAEVLVRAYLSNQV